MTSPRILVVEDSPDLRQAIFDILNVEFEVDSAGDAETALGMIQNKNYQLVLLDVGLPKMDGYAFCTALKAMPTAMATSVIFLSGRDQVEDKLLGFSVGGSDYILKPFDPRELKARIRTRLLDQTGYRRGPTQLDLGYFRVNLAMQKISYLEGTSHVELDLSPLEFKLLYYFLNHVDHVLSRNQLLDRVWGEARVVNDRSVDTVISKLRQKLGPHAQLLQAVRGEGYRLAQRARQSKKEAA